MFEKEPSEVLGLSKSSSDAKQALNPYNKTGEQAALRSKIKIAFSLFSHYKFIFICLEILPSVYNWVLEGFSNPGMFRTEGKASLFALLYPQSHE